MYADSMQINMMFVLLDENFTNYEQDRNSDKRIRGWLGILMTSKITYAAFSKEQVNFT